MKKFFYFLYFFSFIALSSSAQTIVRFKPGPAIGEDAQIFMFANNCIPSGQNTTPANDNYGNAPIARIMAWTFSAKGCGIGYIRTFLRFSELNTLPATATINSATLVLRTAATGMDQGNTVYPGSPHLSRPNLGWLKRVNSGAANNWNEQTITWNTAAALSTDPNPANWVTMPVTNCHFDCTLNLDVTDIVKDIFTDMQNNVANANNGFYMQLQDEVYYRSQTWATSDYADSAYWPELIINYVGCLDSLDLKAQPNPVCAGEDVQLSSRQVPGAKYLWTGPNGFSSSSYNPLLKDVSPNAGGNYILELSGYGNDCRTFDTISVAVNPLPKVDLGPDTMLCAGNFMTLSSKQSYTNPIYKWNTNETAFFIDVKSPGTYWLTVTENGCVGTDSIRVTYDTVNVDLGPDTAICEDGTIVLSSSVIYGNPAYLWNTGNTTASLTVDKEGLYKLSVTERGCTVSDSILVNLTKITVDLGPDSLICDGNPYILQSHSDNYISPTYEWGNGAVTPNLSVHETGTYQLTVKDKGCFGIDSVHLTFGDPFSINLGSDTVLCNNEAIVLNPDLGIGGASYVWNTGSRNSTLPVTNSGFYWLQVIDQYGCLQSDSVLVTYVNLAQGLGNDLLLCREEPIDVTLSANVPPGASTIWSTGESGAKISIRDGGLYWVEVSYAPCVGSDTIRITTRQCDCDVYMPNAFSPNGDGLNDIFHPVMDVNCPISDYSFRIFNRWGQLVYYSLRPGEGWDGTISGKKADLGNYMYLVNYTIELTKEVQTLKGNVILIK